MKNGFSKIAILFAGIALAILIFAPSYYFYSKYQQAQKQLNNPESKQKQEIKSLLEKVGKLIDIPQDEEPTIAVVSDKTKLSPQPFFAKAENGDQVLIFAKAKKAILYRPSTNRIIEVGPVTLGDEASPTSTLSGKIEVLTPTLSAGAKIAIYNGSKIAGLAASTEAKLKGKFTDISVVQKTNSKNDYAKSLVVDLSGAQEKLVSQLADFLNAETGPLPTAETKPQADILVIIAQ